jgi:hypothetical protein
MSIANHDDACGCDDCRVERARRRWYETWCRRTNRRMPRWVDREGPVAAETPHGRTGRRASDH